MFRRSIAVMAMCASFCHAETFWQPVRWISDDGVALIGEYHPAKKDGITWVLLHGLGSTRGEWKKLAEMMARQGDGVLLYDARGHGDSANTLLGQKLNYQEWRVIGPGSPWDLMKGDLGAAVQLLIKQMKLPEDRIAVGGASLGSNVALVYASEHPKVPALLLLSPGLEYAGIQSPVPYHSYAGRPVLMASSPGDAYASASVRQLSGLRADSQQRVVEAKTGHGVQMLDAPFTKTVLDWMKGLHGNRNRRTP